MVIQNSAAVSPTLWLRIGFAALGFVWVLPGHLLPWPAFRQEMVAAVAFLFLAAGALHNSKYVVWPWTAIFAALAATIPLLQWATSLIPFRGDAVLATMYLAGLACAICTGATLARSAHREVLLDGFWSCMAVAALVSTGIGFSQWLGPLDWEPWIEYRPPGERIFANLLQPNQLATLFIVGMVAILYWHEKRRIRPWIAVIAAGWLGWGVAMTGSRSAWVIAALGICWWFVMRRRATLRLTALAIAIAVVAFLLAVMTQDRLVAWWNMDSLTQLEPRGSAVRLEAGTRPIHWRILWDAVTQAPWLGYGWNQIPAAHFAGTANYPATGEWIQHSHNLVLDLFVYNGIPIGLLFCAAILGWFVRTATNCRDSTTWSLILALMAIVVHALFEHPLHFAFWLLPAGLLMGSLSSTSEPTGNPLRAARLTLAAPIVVLAGLFVLAVYEYHQAEEALSDQRLALVGVGPPADLLPRHDWWLMDTWAAYMRATTTTVDAQMADAEYQNLYRVAHRYGYPNTLFAYAQASALRGEIRQATDALTHACKVHSEPVCRLLRTNWERLQLQLSPLALVRFPAR